MHPIHLHCDHAVDPIGIETQRPRLQWLLAGDPDVHGQKQTAYEIRVGREPGATEHWASGRIASDATHTRYAGAPLPSATTVWWQVRVWDESNTVSRWSAPARWTTGILTRADWKGQWIGTDLPFGKEHPLPVFRSLVPVHKPLKRATLFACGLGQFEMAINDQPISADLLAPAWSNYARTCHYVGHDVTALLDRPQNTLHALIGHGMYNVLGGRYTKFKNSLGPHRLIAQLHLEYADGSTEILGTNPAWQVAAGPIVFSCIYGGEDYDATREPSDWRAAILVDPPAGKLIAQDSPPIRVGKRYEALRLTPLADGIQLIDLGQNLSGWPVIRATGARGAKVTVRPGELLDADGRVTQKHTGSPVSFTYTLAGLPPSPGSSGEGRGGGALPNDNTTYPHPNPPPGCREREPEIWHPRFSYTGFRYAEMKIEGDARATMAADFIHTSAPIVGTFECSNEHLNRIHRLINAAILSNYQHVLTDCPHREKLGWIEQLHLMQPSIMWNIDLSRFMHKACRDMRDAQHENGMVPTICPQYTEFKAPWDIFNDSPEWGSAAVIAPWQAYERYGDTRLIEDNYDMMRRYVDYLSTRANEHIIAFGLGDWYDIGKGNPGFAKLTSLALTGTAMYYRDAQIVAAAAKLLGRSNEADRYTELASQIRAAFNTKLVDPKSARVDTGSQCASAMALALGLLEESMKPRVLEQLIQDIRQHDNHITAGDIGFRYVIQALSEAGRSDVIYDLLMQTTPPSYGSQLAAGATTLTEAWDANPTSSHNHLMLGHAESWFWEGLCGLSIDLTQPRERRITIRPQIVGDLYWVKATHRSVLGDIALEWRRTGATAKLQITVPPNTCAEIEIPDPSGQSRQLVESGDSVFNFAL